jgi:uncharacterized protein (DUF697 family)
VGDIIVPALTLLFGYSMQEAIGASLVAVIGDFHWFGSLCGGGVSNVRLGLIPALSLIGGLIGAMVAVCYRPVHPSCSSE